MLTPSTQKERGQAIVLMVVALIGLLGFAALALDGGSIFTEQRRAQAAADNAVMAAAYESAMNGTTDTIVLSNTAAANASQNTYVTDGTTTWVKFNRPPTAGSYAGNPRYYEVVITHTVPTALAHFVYGGPWQVTVRAVAHGDTTIPLMNGYAMAAMGPGCPNGASTIGTVGEGGGSGGGTHLYNGGVFVNSDCTDDALDVNGHDPVYVTGSPQPPINIVGGADVTPCTSINPNNPANCNAYPPPTTGVDPLPQDPIVGTPAATPPTCGPSRTLNAELAASGDGSIRPGSYTDIQPSAGDPTVTMLPGLYCISDTFDSGKNGIQGDGVLLYLTTVSSEIAVTGQGFVDLTAPLDYNAPCTTNPNDPLCTTYRGIVVYKLLGQDDCSNSGVEIEFGGQAAMIVIGLVYAPHSMTRYGGQGSLTMTGQSIVACTKFNGNGNINIHYDPDSVYIPPPVVSLDR